jgi:hypothetical protein
VSKRTLRHDRSNGLLGHDRLSATEPGMIEFLRAIGLCAGERSREIFAEAYFSNPKTCAQRDTLTIAGFALDGKDWDSIFLGRRKGNDLVYAGNVDHGFDKTSVAKLR